jgi:predicted dehydrogenase
MAIAAHQVLIAGCGNIAGGFDHQRPDGEAPLTHAGAYSRNDSFRLAACVEPDVSKRQAFMQRWKIPLGFGSLQEAAAAGVRADVISICTPTAAHAADLESALSLRPRLIFCEKPVTPRLQESQRWVAACEQADVLLAVNYTRRWAPDVIELKRQIDEGRWGALRSLSGLYNKGVLNNGGHLVDLATYLAGPVEAVGATAPVADFFPDDPTVAGLLRTASGIPVTLAVGHAADYSAFELQVVTEQGILVMENGGMNWRLRSPADSPHFPGYRSLGPAVDRAGLYTQAMSAAVENIRCALDEAAPLRSTGQSALHTQRTCEALAAAAQRGVGGAP